MAKYGIRMTEAQKELVNLLMLKKITGMKQSF